MRFSWLPIVAVLSACVFDPAQHQEIEASWTIQQLDGTETSCPASWVTAVLVTTDATGARTEARFPCGRGGGSSTRLPTGSSIAWLEFRDGGDRMIASSFHQTFDVGDWTTPFDATIYVDAGYVAASWTWKDQRWCDDSFNPFEVITLELDGPGGFNQLFSCHDDSGITAPIAPGTYKASIGQGFSRHSLPDVVVEAPNRITQLAPITL